MLAVEVLSRFPDRRRVLLSCEVVYKNTDNLKVPKLCGIHTFFVYVEQLADFFENNLRNYFVASNNIIK